MIIKSAVLLLCLSYAFAQDGAPVEFPPEPMPDNSSTPNPITTTPTKPTTPTTQPTTPSTKPTTPTTKPTTPTTPTTKPTTPTTKPTTPTTKPTTPTTKATTTNAPTPSPTPAPSGEPAINNFSANNTVGKNTYCLIATMALQLEILGNKTTNSTKINVPQNVTFNGNCSSLNIYWQNYSIIFNFEKRDSKIDVANVTTILPLKQDGNLTTLFHNKSEFVVSEKQSYACAKDEPLTLNNTDNSAIIAKLHITHLKYQAFVNKTQVKFDSAWNCEHANTSDVVPIVVGCVLVLLVVLMLVAYLVARRRCQARGYLSM